MHRESLYRPPPSFAPYFSYRALLRYPILSAADGFFRDDTKEGGVSAKSEPGCCSIFSRMACCSAARRRSFINYVRRDKCCPPPDEYGSYIKDYFEWKGNKSFVYE